MGLDAWNLTAKPCDSCKANPSTVFCHADSAFLCVGCDSKIHAVNKLASRHSRVWMCEVCEQAPAIVTCKADAAALCAVCDRDIHSANPLARRHERVPIVPFHDSEPPIRCNGVPDHLQQQQNTDGVVPVQIKTDPTHFHGPAVVDGFPTYDMDYSGSKPYMYNFSSQTISQSVSSSSMEVGVVPDQNAMADESNNPGRSDGIPSAITGADREARVLRYKEKRKNRKFEKTIRYASRKAYAETRPRIKGRFAKRTEIEIESLLVAESSYGVVPTF